MRTQPKRSQQRQYDTRYNQFSPSPHSPPQPSPYKSPVAAIPPQSSGRKKTIYAYPYNPRSDTDIAPITITIRSDQSSLSKVLEQIQRARGGSSVPGRVVGLYHQADRSRIKSPHDIAQGEHVIYVCQGEVQSTTSYASSQSSDGSQRHPRSRSRGQVRRDNSFEAYPSGGRSSPIIQLSSPTVQQNGFQHQARSQSPSARPQSNPQFEAVPRQKLPNNLFAAKRSKSSPSQQQFLALESVYPVQEATQSSPVQSSHAHYIPSSSQSVASDQISLAGGIPSIQTNTNSNVQRFLTDPHNDLFRTPNQMTSQQTAKNKEEDARQGRSSSFSFDTPSKEKRDTSGNSQINNSSQDRSSNQRVADILNGSSKKEYAPYKFEIGSSKNLTAAEILEQGQSSLYSEISLDLGIGSSSSQTSSTFYEVETSDEGMISPFENAATKMPVIHEVEDEEDGMVLSSKHTILSGISLKNFLHQKKLSKDEEFHSSRQMSGSGIHMERQEDSDPRSQELDKVNSKSSSLKDQIPELPVFLTTQAPEDVVSARKNSGSINKGSVTDSNSISIPTRTVPKRMSDNRLTRSKSGHFCSCLYPPDVRDD